ncbi:MAG: glycosyltransferase family 2 protein [Candidatus Omnitrophica bacterium]|nr:glycosyltransferase family 2 protein [Candidatus Omnitrophota bacterium]
MLLSVVIPAYNEERSLGGTLSAVHKFLSSKKYDHEVIVVDDGSKDATADIAKKSPFAPGKLIVISNEKNMGKGFSVRRGVLAAKGDLVLVTDADLSTPISEVDKLIAFMDKGFDVVIGSRDVSDSKVVKHQPLLRETMGKTFNLFVKALLIGDFNDTQCGFKLFKGASARETAKIMKIDGFCYDVEMLYLLRRKGYKIKEAGVVWENDPHTKVKVFNSSFSMFMDLFRIKMWYG